MLTGRNPRFRLAWELKVMIESLSCGVNVSSKNFIVSLRSYILEPLIEPLTSRTHIRSTPALYPPYVIMEHMAGKIVLVLSLTIDV